MKVSIIKTILQEKFGSALMAVGAHWEIDVERGKFRLYCFVDELTDRLHIMIPIQRADTPDLEFMMKLLSANFSSALDAKYAVHEG